MNNLESLLQAEEEIKPYLVLFKECYEKAIVKYNAFRSFFTEPMYNRTKAINFHNIIVNEIKAAFSQVEEAQIIEKYESISLVLKNHISARFKKLNGNGLPSNHVSGRNNAIIAQQIEILFLDYPPIARVDVGYTMDITGTNYELLKVVCRKDKEILWDLYFHDSAEGEEGIESEERVKPIIPTPVLPPTGRAIPKVKKKDKKAE